MVDEKHSVYNILKIRDYPEQILFESLQETDERFKLLENCQCSWAKYGEQFGPAELREQIEPWLSALFQSEHLSLLLGSGLTHAIHGIANPGTSLPGMTAAEFNVFKAQIKKAAALSAKKAGRGKGNIEDQIRVANELLIGLEHYCIDESELRDAKELKQRTLELRKDIIRILKDFARSILLGEKNIALAKDDDRIRAFTYLVSFLMSFASRSGTRERLHIFTTNYDRLIEVGAELAGLHLIDRFVGQLAPIFRSTRLNIDLHYNPPGIRGEPRYLEGVAYFTKLHGSIDWIDVGGQIRRIGLPFGADSIDPYLKAPGLEKATTMDLMVYPNAAKDRETATYPYAELFRDFAAAICRPNSTLITYGYSFGDDHINRVIEDMLTIPSTHLVIISFNDPLNRIKHFYRSAQTTLLIGPHLGNLKKLVNHYLPKPAIDFALFRMAKLLSMRGLTEQPTESNKPGGDEM